MDVIMDSPLINEYIFLQFAVLFLLKFTYISINMRLKIDSVKNTGGITFINLATENNKYVKQPLNFMYDCTKLYRSLHQIGHNSSIILTGELYDVFCITVDNNNRSVQKFNKLCKKYGFDKKTLTIRTMSDGYHYFFRLNDRQKEALRGYDLSGMKLFGLDIEPKYNNQ